MVFKIYIVCGAIFTLWSIVIIRERQKAGAEDMRLWEWFTGLPLVFMLWPLIIFILLTNKEKENG